MKKKNVVILCAALAVAIAAGIFFLPYLVPHKAASLLKLDFEQVDGIMVNNYKANMSCKITDKKDVDALISAFKKANYIKQRSFTVETKYDVMFERGDDVICFCMVDPHDSIITGKNATDYKAKDFDVSLFNKIIKKQSWTK